MAHVLPSNATPIEIALEGIASEALAIPVDISKLWSPDDCPASHLHILAAIFSVDVWDSNWSEATKRAVIKSAAEVHRHKGTRAALNRALGALGLGVTAKEWFEYGGSPYCFRLYVQKPGGVAPTTDELRYIRNIALGAKNARSYLEDILVSQPAQDAGLIYVAGATNTRLTIRIE